MDVSVINKLMKIFDKNIFKFSSDLTIPAIIPNGDWSCVFPISWLHHQLMDVVTYDGDLQRSKKICIIVIGLGLSINQIA